MACREMARTASAAQGTKKHLKKPILLVSIVPFSTAPVHQRRQIDGQAVCAGLDRSPSLPAVSEIHGQVHEVLPCRGKQVDPAILGEVFRDGPMIRGGTFKRTLVARKEDGPL